MLLNYIDDVDGIFHYASVFAYMDFHVSTKQWTEVVITCTHFSVYSILYQFHWWNEKYFKRWPKRKKSKNRL